MALDEDLDSLSLAQLDQLIHVRQQRAENLTSQAEVTIVDLELAEQELARLVAQRNRLVGNHKGDIPMSDPVQPPTPQPQPAPPQPNPGAGGTPQPAPPVAPPIPPVPQLKDDEDLKKATAVWDD